MILIMHCLLLRLLNFNKDAFNLSKVTVKSCQINAVLYLSKNPEKRMIRVIYEAAQLLILLIIINASWAVNQHIRMISEDHVTLKTGVMMLKIQLWSEIKYIWKYIHIENRYFKLNYFSHSMFTVFLFKCIFLFCNIGLHKRLLSKTLVNSGNTKLI